MADVYTVELSKIIKEFSLETIYMPEDGERIPINLTDVNRPGLQLAGFFDHFEAQRIQIIGKVEYKFLEHMNEEERKNAIMGYLEKKPVTVVFTSSLEVFEEFKELGEYFEVPILRTADTTSSFMAALIAYLNVQLAPRITRHGVLVEVYGEGIRILGESGVGKSETAIELVKRGHRLVADDAVEIKRVSDKTLVGSSPEIIRHFVELRGIGIIDVKEIFGIGAVKDTESIDMIIHLEPWEDGKQYDRLGMVDEFTNIMGINVPSLTIPVKLGRNLAVIVEVAAMNNRQKRMGYNAAVELNNRLMNQMESQLNM